MSMKNFEKITASPEVLAKCLEEWKAQGPWDYDFMDVFCESCKEKPGCCNAKCPHIVERNGVLWWLGLDAKEEEPNVCKMLGIGVGVKFRIGNDRTIFWVNRDGSFGTEPACVPGSTYLFLKALNGQEKITLVEKEKPQQIGGVEETEKEDQKPKSRLAEILGVEEDEEWTATYLPETSGSVYRVHSGRRQYKLKDGGWSDCHVEEDLSCIINHPENVVHIPRLTEAELAICKYVGAKWVSKDKIRDDGGASLWRKKPDYWDELYDSEESDALIATFFDKDVFSNVHPGDCICVEEVTGE